MYPPEITDTLLGNWDIRDRDIHIIEEVGSEKPFFNAERGVFKIGYYDTGIRPKRVFIKGYGDEGLSLNAGLNEAAAFAIFEEMKLSTPLHALDLSGKESYQQEVIGVRVDKVSEQNVADISKQQYLQFASMFPVVGADDFRGPNLFIGISNRLWAIDLDSSMSDLTKVGEFYDGEDRKFKRTVNRIVNESENFEFTVTEQEVLEQVRRTSAYIVSSEKEHVHDIIARYRNKRTADAVVMQIEDFAEGDFSKYHTDGKRSFIERGLRVLERIRYSL